MNINFIRQKLESPKDENERLWAFGILQQIREDANNLYTKYSKLGRDWTKETKSDK